MAFAPEVLALTAACQTTASVASAKHLQNQGYTHWTVIHSFYAGSGQFCFHVPEDPLYPEFPAFPVNSRATAYLAEKGYIKIPSITRKGVVDKSKVGRCVKVVALVRISCWIFGSIAQCMPSLEITLL